MRNTITSESDLQTEIVKYFRKAGYLIIKNHSGLVHTKDGHPYTLGLPGFPDLTLFFDNGEISLIEVKKNGSVLSLEQVQMHLRLYHSGYLVWIFNKHPKIILEEIREKGVPDDIFTPNPITSHSTRLYKYVSKQHEHLVAEAENGIKKDLLK